MRIAKKKQVGGSVSLVLVNRGNVTFYREAKKLSVKNATALSFGTISETNFFLSKLFLFMP